MKNSQIRTAKSTEPIYQCIIDGIVYRGSKDYIQQVIRDDRENRS